MYAVLVYIMDGVIVDYVLSIAKIEVCIDSYFNQFLFSMIAFCIQISFAFDECYILAENFEKELRLSIPGATPKTK